jgi:hypothetical protein
MPFGRFFFSSSTTVDDSLRGVTPPAYTSHPSSSAPTYAGSPTASAHRRNSSQRSPSASSVSSPGCEAIFEQASLAEEGSFDETSAEPRPPGPRYGELGCYRRGSSLIIFYQFTTEFMQRMGQFHPRGLSIPTICTWAVSAPTSSRRLSQQEISSIAYPVLKISTRKLPPGYSFLPRAKPR